MSHECIKEFGTDTVLGGCHFFSSFLKFRSCAAAQHMYAAYKDMHSQGGPVRFKDEDGYLIIRIQSGRIERHTVVQPEYARVRESISMVTQIDRMS